MIHSVLLGLAFVLAADGPITRVEGLTPQPTVFQASSRNKPLVIRSLKEAEPHFGKEALLKIAKDVNFKQRVLLVFAWKGSGQDKLSYAVAESFPEQVMFQYTPGRTRDLRPHIYIYSLRSNVKWSTK